MKLLVLPALLTALAGCSSLGEDSYNYRADPVYQQLVANAPKTLPPRVRAQLLENVRTKTSIDGFCDVFNKGTRQQYATCWYPSHLAQKPQWVLYEYVRPNGGSVGSRAGDRFDRWQGVAISEPYTF